MTRMQMNLFILVVIWLWLALVGFFALVPGTNFPTRYLCVRSLLIEVWCHVASLQLVILIWTTVHSTLYALSPPLRRVRTIICVARHMNSKCTLKKDLLENECVLEQGAL